MEPVITAIMLEKHAGLPASIFQQQLCVGEIVEPLLKELANTTIDITFAP